MRCPHCGHEDIIRTEDGFLVCSRCGYIIDRYYEADDNFVFLESEEKSVLPNHEYVWSATTAPHALLANVGAVVDKRVKLEERLYATLQKLCGLLGANCNKRELVHATRCFLRCLEAEEIGENRWKAIEDFLHTLAFKPYKVRFSESYRRVRPLLKCKPGDAYRCLEPLIKHAFVRFLLDRIYKLNEVVEHAVRIGAEALAKCVYFYHMALLQSAPLFHYTLTSRVGEVYSKKRFRAIVNHVSPFSVLHCIRMNTVQYGRHVVMLKGRTASFFFRDRLSVQTKYVQLRGSYLLPVYLDGEPHIRTPKRAFYAHIVQLGSQFVPYVQKLKLRSGDVKSGVLHIDSYSYHAYLMYERSKGSEWALRPKDMRAFVLASELVGYYLLKEVFGEDVRGAEVEVEFTEDGKELVERLNPRTFVQTELISLT